jgi:hypothetical protein
MGLKVPMTSRGFAPRADLDSESQPEDFLHWSSTHHLLYSIQAEWIAVMFDVV